jgi:hypothetical protein
MVGSASIAFFLSPFGGGLEVRCRRQVQREARARPRRQTSAHRRDARITAMFEFTAIPSGAVCCSGEVGGDVSPEPAATAARCRRLSGARMVLLYYATLLDELSFDSLSLCL